jgi:hypothetical protein
MTREFKRRNVLSDVEELVSDGFLEITQDQLEVFADALDVEHIPPDERGFLLDLLIPTEQRLDELGGDLAERGDHIRRAGTCGLLLDLVEVCGANLKVEDGSVFVSPGKQSVSEKAGITALRTEVFSEQARTNPDLSPVRDAWLRVMLLDSLAYSHDQCLRALVSVLQDEYGEGRHVERLEVIGWLCDRMQNGTRVEKDLFVREGMDVFETMFEAFLEHPMTNPRAMDKVLSTMSSKRLNFRDVFELDYRSAPPWCALASWARLILGMSLDEACALAARETGQPVDDAALGYRQILAPMARELAENPMTLAQAVERVCVFVANLHHKYVYEQLSGPRPRDAMVLMCEGTTWAARPGVGELMDGSGKCFDNVGPRIARAFDWLRQLDCITDGGNALTTRGERMRDRACDLCRTAGAGL